MHTFTMIPRFQKRYRSRPYFFFALFFMLFSKFSLKILHIIQQEDENYLEAFKGIDVIHRGKHSLGCQCVMCEIDQICGGLWKGGTIGGDASHIKNVHLVVSHCENSLLSVMNFANESQNENIRVTVISKCGNEIKGLTNSVKISNTLRVPNVGGCDHSFAHFLNIYSREGLSSLLLTTSDVIVFLKDTDRSVSSIHQPAVYRSLNEMLRIVSKEGFACGMEPTAHPWYASGPSLVSAYHVTSILQTFDLGEYSRWNSVVVNGNTKNDKFRSKFRNLGDFHRYLQMSISDDVVQVCYGGSFAVSVKNIQRIPNSLWGRLEHVLSRGDNIEEGHFAERTWAALLATPLTNSLHIKALQNFSTSILQRNLSIIGAFQRESSNNR